MPWPAESRIPALLLEGALKSTALLSLALVVSSFFRRHSASLRHFILSFSLISLILIPAFLFISAGWETTLLPSWLGGRPLTQALPQGLPGFSASKGDPPSLERGQASILPVEAAPPVSEAYMSLPAKNRAGYRAGPLLGYTVLAVWCAGLFLLLLRMGLGLWGASRLTRQGECLDDSAWRMLLDRFLNLISLKKKVVLKCHCRVVFPLTWGWRRPVILMPEEARTWTEPRRSSALLHELSHVKRADFLVMMLVRLSLAFFWFNPLAWLVLGKMKKEQEKACDEGVVRAGVKPSAYAFHLLSFQKRRGGAPGPTLALLGLFDRSPINDRLFAILKQKLAFKEVTMKTKMMISLAVVLAVILVGTARPSSPRTEPEDAAVHLEEALPGPGPVPAVAVQEKKEPQEKKEAKKTFVVKAKDKEEGTVEIILTEGEKEKRMILETPVTIKQTDKPERTLVILSKDEEVLTIKGSDFRLEIEPPCTPSAKIEGKTIVLEKGKELEGKEPEVHIIAEPRVKIIKEGQLKIKELQLEKMLEQIKENLKAVEEKSQDLRDVLEKHRAGLTAAKEAELKRNLEEVLQRLESDLDSSIDVQKEALRKLEERLKGLAVELEKKEAAPGAFTIVRQEGVMESETDIKTDKKDREITITVTSDKDDKDIVAVAVKTQIKKADRETYDQAVEKMKNELPEGFSLESEFYEDSGTAVLKIRAPRSEEQKARDLLLKLLKILKEGL